MRGCRTLLRAFNLKTVMYIGSMKAQADLKMKLVHCNVVSFPLFYTSRIACVRFHGAIVETSIIQLGIQ